MSGPGAIGIVFDGDDTLWSTELLYDAARSAARQIVESEGYDGAEWESTERRLDVQNVEALGYGTERFPTSCVRALEELSRQAGRLPDKLTLARIRRAANTVFETRPRLVDGAEATLFELRRRGARLALVTKGDHGLQTKRIDQSGLRTCFDVVRIVSEKSATIFLEVVALLGVDPKNACVVGNSMRSDMLPALQAGLRAIWIPAHVWEYERALDDRADARVTVLSRLTDLLEVLR